MVYAIGLAEATPCTGSVADCGHRAGVIVWDDACGWLHVDGFYACRNPIDGRPREVTAASALARP